jgi:transposase InsO family protein
LVQPPRAVVAAVDHDGGGILRRDAGGRPGSARQTGDLQHRPGLAVLFVERLWRSVKYEEVYLRAYDNVSEARSSIGRYLDFYNGRRPHSSLDGATPDHAYFTPLPLRMAA